jgi:hypothetical protein
MINSLFSEPMFTPMRTGGKLLVALFALAHVAGVDAVFIQRLRAARHLGEQAMAVIVEVANDGGRDPGVAHA